MSRVGFEQFSLSFFIHVSHMTEILVIILFIACSVTELKQGAMSAREENMVLLVFSLVLAKLSSLIYFQKSLLCVCSKRRLFFSLQHIGGRQNVSEIPQCHLYYLEKSLSCKIDSLSQNSEFVFPLRSDFLTTHESNNSLVLWGSLALLYLCFFKWIEMTSCQKLNNDGHGLQEPLF